MTTRASHERILRTKLHRPRAPRDFVRRGRLQVAMDQGAGTTMTLVSAPAGYGKSLLVSDWVATRDAPCAWLSLDDTDSPVDLFLDHLLAAIETVFPAACPETRLLIQAAERPPLPVLGTCLVNELDALSATVLIVLDDYHRIEPDSQVHELLRQVLSRPPRSLRLVVVSRRDPPLRLTLLRSREQLTEVRLADLCFTASETRALLAATLGIRVSHQAIDNLQHELEGWAVGLRLVSLAVRRDQDPDGALRTLRGGIRYAREYLIQEVIDGQTPRMRNWLLQTSILDRFCAGLCEAVCVAEEVSETDSFDGELFIRTLRESNLFAIELDAEGVWLRYHHLFQELLRSELHRSRTPEAIDVLHAQASRWLEAQGMIADSLRHALAAGPPLAAAEIFERHRREEQDRDRWWNVDRWLKLLPPAIVEQRPGLLLAQACMLHYRHRQAEVAQVVERLTQITGDDKLDPLLTGELKLFQGTEHFWGGRLTQARDLLLQAQDLLPPSYPSMAGLNQVYLALAGQMLGHRDSVLDALDRRSRGAERQPAKYRVNLATARGLVRTLCGDLDQAAEDARQILQIARGQGFAYNEAWGHYLAGCSLFRAGEVAAAVPCFLASSERRYVMYMRAAIDAMAGLALSYQALNRSADAEAAAEDLLEFARGGDDPDATGPAESTRARLALARGDLDAAARWSRSLRGRIDRAPLFVWLENPVLTRARVWIAIGARDLLQDAAELLARLGDANAAVHNRCQQVEILILQSLALWKLQRTDEALTLLQRVLGLGEPGGWIRAFVEAGTPMTDLLRRLIERSGDGFYTDRLLAALAGAGSKVEEQPGTRGADAAAASLAASLTARELDILECLTRRLRNKEIARRLSVSEETVKFHLKNLYQKLRVKSRREAAVRAEDLRPFLKAGPAE